jgi:hypothetical protein
MGTAATQAAAIAAIIDAVTDTGLVYDYQPVPKGLDWATYTTKFVTTIGGVDQVRAWTVSYQGEDRAFRTVAIGATKLIRKFEWLVRGYLGWQDPDSDATFRDLNEAVVTALDTNRSLNGTAIDHEATRVTLPNDGQGVLLGDVLCHYVEMRISPWVEESLATV